MLLPLVLFFCSGCVPWNTPQVVYVKTDVDFLSFDTVMARSQFTIDNPNPFPLHGKVEYELFVKGNKFLEGTSNDIQMPANGRASFTLQSKIQIAKSFGVITDLINEIQAGKETVPFEINGKFKSDVVNIPIEAPLKVSGELPLPKLPKVDFESLSLTSLSLDGTTLKLKIRLKNDNAFPIKVDPFPYQLVTEGKELVSGNLREPVNIRAGESTDVVIDVKLNFSELSQTLLNSIKEKSVKAEVKSDFGSIR